MMAAYGSWTNFFKFACHVRKITKRKHVISGVCSVCGLGLAYFSGQQYKNSSVNGPELTKKSFFKQRVVFAASSNETATQSQVKRTDVYLNTRQKRFLDFASVQVNGECFMTPQDFLESVTEEEPRPRIGRLKLSDSAVRNMLAKTPEKKKNSTCFFRSLHNQGLISYTEYLFFLCILTKPKAGFSIAFNMFDTDGNQKVDKKEFTVLGEIFRKRTENAINQDKMKPKLYSSQQQNRNSRITAIKENDIEMQDTTLLVHLFGRKGSNAICYEEFYRFMDNLQTEVLEIEFLAYSHGLVTISEEDFARTLLKYTEIAETEEHIDTLRKRIPEEKGITFDEFRSFFQFLNNLEDFAIALQLYTLAGKTIGQDEFKRAVKVSTGHELSEHLVNTVFQLFDKDGDNHLSEVEFIGVMKDRIQRGFKSQASKQTHGWSGFQKCLRNHLRNNRN